jgi:hypothetical protein
MPTKLFTYLIFLFLLTTICLPVAFADQEGGSQAESVQNQIPYYPEPFNLQNNASELSSDAWPNIPPNFKNLSADDFSYRYSNSETKPNSSTLKFNFGGENKPLNEVGLDSQPLAVKPQGINGQFYQETALNTSVEASQPLLDDKLTLFTGFNAERHVFQDYGLGPANSKPLGYNTMTYGFGANLNLSEEWSLGASLITRNSSSLDGSAGQGTRKELGDNIDFRRSAPADLTIGELGLQYYKPQSGTTAKITAYAGEISSSANQERDGISQSLRPYENMLEIQGLELSVQQSIFEGRLTFLAATIFNYYRAKDATLSQNSGKTNLSAFLSLTYKNPAIANTSILFRYAGDGNYITNRFFSSPGKRTIIDARIWRDFNLSPALTLSTQLYGSSLIEAYFDNYNNSFTSPYLEGRVTMNYSF